MDSSLRIDDAKSISTAFENINIPFRIDGNCPGINKRAVNRRLAILRYACFSISCYRRNQSGLEIYTADPVVRQVGHIDVTLLAVNRHRIGFVKTRF